MNGKVTHGIVSEMGCHRLKALLTGTGEVHPGADSVRVNLANPVTAVICIKMCVKYVYDIDIQVEWNATYTASILEADF